MSRNKTKGYFPHDEDATDDPKMMMLISQLGLEGYGIYWVLIEYLRKQPGYVAPLMIVDSLARRFGSSREKFEVVITKYNDLFDTPLFLIDGFVFYSPSLQDRMMKLDIKREKMRSNALVRWDGDTNALQLHNKSNAKAMQSKVKESKVKKSKVKKSKEENNTLPVSLSFIENANKVLVKKWDEWCSFRKLLKKPYKTTPGAAAAYNKLLKLADDNSELAIQIIDQSIENEWLGFFPLKTVARGVKSGVAAEDPVDRHIREVMDIMKSKNDLGDGAEK